MSRAHVDFETRSTVDLKATGIDVYSKDPTTDVWCMAYAFDDEPVKLWVPGEDIPADLAMHVELGEDFIAHNTSFEFHIWNHILAPRYGFPELSIDQCFDTMAMAYAQALPGSLQNAAAAVGLEQDKDMKGHRLMMQMAKPRRVEADGTLVWWDDADRRTKLYDYCRQDVEVERALDAHLRQLPPSELEMWRLDQAINMRGVPIDMEAVLGALKVVADEKDQLDQRMRELTDDWVTGVANSNQLNDWINKRGYETKGVSKDKVVALLDDPDLDDVAREVLTLRQEGNKTSTAKLVAMREAASEDNRVRGVSQYHGAATGRWAGRRIQTQNFPRPSLKQHAIDAAFPYLEAGDRDGIELMFGPPVEVVSSCLRGMIAAPKGKILRAADWSNIEGRGLAWLSGEDWKLRAFNEFDGGTGPDLYKLAYGNSFGVDPDDVGSDERQIGKVQELALGYEGGVGAFVSMAKIYGMDVAETYDVVWPKASEEQRHKAEDLYKSSPLRTSVTRKAFLAADVIKQLWRAAHPATTQFWRDLRDASISAVADPGNAYSAGRHITFKVQGSFLWCRLPSGRLLSYPYPRLKDTETPWGSTQSALYYKTVNQLTRRWEETHTHGGKLAENVTQAICADILRFALVNLEDENYPVVFHVHDEAICEMDEDFGSLAEMEAIMERTPPWAAGFPIKAEGWEGKRFRK